MTREPICKWDGSECYSRGRKKEMPCSMCGLTIAPGSVSVPKFTDNITPTTFYNVAGQQVPQERDYFCADCFRSSRPYESWRKCSGSQRWHELEKEANARHAEARRPPGPPPGSPPSTALAIPSPSSAASVSASSGGDINIDRPNLVHVVERLQQEMREMKEHVETLEQAVRGIARAVALTR